MTFLKTGLKRTTSAVKEHKRIFVLLLVLEAVVLTLFGFVFIDYQLKIFADIEGITLPLASANYNETSIQQGTPFLEDAVSVIKSYSSMVRHVLEMVSLFAGIFIFINGSIWLLSHWMVEEKKPEKKPLHITIKKQFNRWLKFLAAFAAITLPFAALGYCLFKLFFSLSISPDSSQFQLAFQVMPYLMMVAYYFLISAFAMINTVSWKDFFRKWVEVSVQKIYLTLIVLLVCLILVLISLGSISLAMSYEPANSLLFILTPILLAVLALTRLFWIACLQEIVKEDEKNRY